MAKSTSNSAKRIFGRKSINTIYTLSILSFVIQDFKKNFSILLCFKADNFIFRTLSVTSAISPVSVASFSIMEKWSKSSRCWIASDVGRCWGAFSSWSSSSSSETTFTAWLALEVSGATSLIASSRACYRQSIKLVFIWPVDVVRVSSKVTKSSTVISSSSRCWVKRLSNSSSISLSLWMLLIDSCSNPYFWKQLIIVSVEIFFQATCNQWIAFAMLTSFIISEAFLPSSIRETTYFSSLFLYLHQTPWLCQHQVAAIEKL